VSVKFCSKCNQDKDISEFQERKGTRPTREAHCKSCVAEYKRAWSRKNKERLVQKKREYYQEQKHYIKETRAQTKEELQIKQKLYREKNKEKIAQSLKEWRKANKDRLQKYDSAYKKQKKLLEPNFKLVCLLRVRLKKALANKQKTGSAVRDLGMPIDAFLTYLNLDAIDKYGLPYTGNESKFHIDHIRPLASFNLEDVKQLKQAVHWSNLQVLRAEENLQKGAEYVQPTTSNPPISAQGKVATP